MEHRSRAWRRHQAARVFKARLKYCASCCGSAYEKTTDGPCFNNPTWKDLKKEGWTQVYRTTGTPCSCIMCTGEHYRRLDFKRETERILKEEDL